MSKADSTQAGSGAGNCIDKKLVAGLERLSRVFRSLSWNTAYQAGLNPVQLRILIFLQHHPLQYANTSYLAAEFGVSVPSISDTVKSLRSKGLVVTEPRPGDGRKHTLRLTPSGSQVAIQADMIAHPALDILAGYDPENKLRLWEILLSLIAGFNGKGLIRADRSCFSCASYELRDGTHYCRLIGSAIRTENLLIDCREHDPTTGITPAQ